MSLTSQFLLSGTEQNAATAILQRLEHFTHDQRKKILLNIQGAVDANASSAPKEENTYYTDPNSRLGCNW